MQACGLGHDHGPTKEESPIEDKPVPNSNNVKVGY